jgi:hypothetical protein
VADNTTLNAGSGGDVIATDDIAGVKYQRVKPAIGDDGSAADVSAANPMPMVARASSSAVTSVSASASSVSLLASNANRRGAAFYNDSPFALYLKLGATASTSSFTVKIEANQFWALPFPCFTGAIDGIWESATGSARITELT